MEHHYADNKTENKTDKKNKMLTMASIIASNYKSNTTKCMESTVEPKKDNEKINK